MRLIGLNIENTSSLERSPGEVIPRSEATKDRFRAKAFTAVAQQQLAEQSQ